MSDRTVLVFEFNELCPPLLRRFMDEGSLPNFRRLHDESAVFTTDAGEEEPYLEPWIQWLTVHTGLPYPDHGVYHLGDGRDLKAPGVAAVLAERGMPVGVFESMNTNYGALPGYVIPDPWDRRGTPHPADLEPLFRFVARNVQEASTGSSSRDGAAGFAWFLLRNGLRPGTMSAVAGQLAAERRDADLSWRRPSLLEAMQYDVFRHLNRKHGVRFATFFGNSTAHYQHYFWRNFEPERFAEPPAETHPSLADAVPYGYRAMDRILGRAFDDFPDATFVMATALSQQPWDTAKRTYRPRAFEEFLRFAGVDPAGVTVKPVMAEQFHVECADDIRAASVAAALTALRAGGEQLMHVRPEGTTVFSGCRITDPSAPDWTVEGAAGRENFGDLFHQVHGTRSGRHHPDGAFWVRGGGAPAVHRERVPLTDVAPTLLSLFDVPAPPTMKGRPLPV